MKELFPVPGRINIKNNLIAKWYERKDFFLFPTSQIHCTTLSCRYIFFAFFYIVFGGLLIQKHFSFANQISEYPVHISGIV